MMTALKTSAFVLSSTLLAAALSGCAMPTEEGGTIDNRPQISFRSTTGGPAAEVFVDGLAAGRTDAYLEGKAALRVLPGTHVVEIRRADGTVSKQTIYVADGVTKTLLY